MGGANHRFAILASFLYLVSLSPRVASALFNIIHSSLDFNSGRALYGKNCNSCIILMLRYALCPIQHYDSCTTGAVHSTLIKETCRCPKVCCGS
ncbi:hypothetical protein DFH29DRAFT_855115 [Suillus ampliporus]|nr:hypothetical protein DFH29DRAFT_855115 [Suillus ampliporus]